MMKVCRELDRDDSAWRAASACMASGIVGRYFLVEITTAEPNRWMDPLHPSSVRRAGAAWAAVQSSLCNEIGAVPLVTT